MKRVITTLCIALLLAAAAAQDEPVVLQFWEGHSAQEEAATIQMIEAFEAANPDIDIERTKVSFGGNFEKITTALASNTAPDVSPIWGGFLTQFAEAGALVDLSEYGVAELQDDIYPAGWSFVQWNDGIYGVPYAVDPRFIAYSEEAFQDAGIETAPTTFEEFEEAAQALTLRAGNTVERYGFALGEADALLNTYLNFLYANGGQVFNEDQTEAAFNSEAGVEAAEFLANLVQQGYATTGVEADSLRQSLINNRVGMIIDGPWIFYDVANSEVPFEFGIAPIPTSEEGAEGGNVATAGAYAVYAQSEHPEEAARFVQFLASPEAQQYRVEVLKPGVSPGVLEAEAAQGTFQEWPQLETAQLLLDASTIYPIHPSGPGWSMRCSPRSRPSCPALTPSRSSTTPPVRSSAPCGADIFGGGEPKLARPHSSWRNSQ